MADILTVAQATDNLTPSAHRADMLIDWQNGMRQVDIAAKYGCSQGMVSKLIGSSPRLRNTAPPEPNLLSLEEQHEALSHLRDCLDHDPNDPYSDGPDREAIAKLVGQFRPSTVWDRQ